MSTKFTLHIDPVKVDREHKVLERSQLYGAFNPMVTKLEDLGIDSKQNTEQQSFLYGNKDMGYFYTQCKEYATNKELPATTSIPCFYCTEPFYTQPLGIPISFTPSFCVGNDGVQTVLHNETEKQRAIKNGMTIYHRDYYEVDGNFCSFPCMLSYLKHNKGPYTESLSLLKQMHYELFRSSMVSRWAPDIRLLKKFGGHLTIQEWRSDEGQKYVSVVTLNRPTFSEPSQTPKLVPVTKMYRYNGQK